MIVAPGADRAAGASPLDRLVDAIPVPGVLITGVSVVALVLLGVAAGTAGSTSTVASSGGLKVVHIGGASVLANAKGFTLYWFAPDTSSKSVCNGSCAVYWPPVKGPATAGPGVTRQADRDHPVRRVQAGRLQRPSAVHLRR